MEVNRRNYSNLEVMQHSNCLLAFCIVAGLIVFAIALAVAMGTGWELVGIALYVCIISVIILFVCVTVIIYQLRMLRIDHGKRVKENKLLDQRLEMQEQALKMVAEGGVKLKMSEKELLFEVVYKAENARQQAARVVVEAGQPAALPSGQKAPAIILSRPLIAPPAFDLMEAMKDFSLAEDSIYLGRGYKRDFACDPRYDLCHGAFNAVSGRGKTIAVKGVESQLLKVGHEVIHADIKYMLMDEKGNDYRPIARALMAQGDIQMGNRQLPHLLMREDHIVYMIEWLVYYELRRRLAMAARGDHSYGVLYVFLEELQYLVASYKHLGQIIPRLLIVGRSLGIKIFCVAQSFQVQNLKLNTGIRENFESAWFLGGDDQSAAYLLDMTLRELKRLIAENNIKLGNGVTLFRNNVFCYDADILRVGMASNDFVYWLFGRADDFMLPDTVLPQFDEDNDSVEGAKEHHRSQTRVTGPLKGTVVPTRKSDKRATIDDATEVWNTFPYGVGRVRLQEELQARGFECSDDLARKFVKAIRRELDGSEGETTTTTTTTNDSEGESTILS